MVFTLHDQQAKWFRQMMGISAGVNGDIAKADRAFASNDAALFLSAKDGEHCVGLALFSEDGSECATFTLDRRVLKRICESHKKMSFVAKALNRSI